MFITLTTIHLESLRSLQLLTKEHEDQQFSEYKELQNELITIPKYRMYKRKELIAKIDNKGSYWYKHKLNTDCWDDIIKYIEVFGSVIIDESDFNNQQMQLLIDEVVKLKFSDGVYEQTR